MKRLSAPALAVGAGVLLMSLVQATLGHPPYAFIEAFFLAAGLVMLSAMGGFEWGFACLLFQALVAGIFREAWESAMWLGIIACVWYAGSTLLAARGSRVLMGIAAGVLFAGLLAERIGTLTLQQWLIYIALFLLEVSGLYLAGNVLRGRWFSPYA